MSLAFLCGHTSVARENNEKNMRDVLEHWNSKSGIREMHGEAGMTNGQSYGSYKEIDWLLKAKIDGAKNFHPDYILKDTTYARLKREINEYDRRLTKRGFVNPLENIIGVPETIVRRSPLMYRSYNEINEQLSYERTHIGYLRDFTAKVSSSILSAFKSAAERGEISQKGVKIVRSLQKLETQIQKSESKAVRAAYEQAVDALIAEDGQGKLLGAFREYVEMPKRKWNRTKKDVDVDMVKAVNETKDYFSKMSSVLLNGMDQLSDNYLLRKHGTSDRTSAVVKTDPVTQAFLANIKQSKAGILSKKQEGSYFPHYVLKDLPQLMQSVDQMMYFGNEAKFNKAARNAENVMMEMGALSRKAKGRSGLDFTWHSDPIMVATMYGYDVIGFNKQNKLQNTMINFLREMPKDPKVSADFVDGMTKYMDDIYTMATRGYKDRPDWVNDWVHLLGSATVIRTMGYGFTGSIRNLASMSHFYAYFGHKTVKNAIDVYNKKSGYETDEEGKKVREKVGSIVRRREQENGFLFGEGGTDVANELITFGLLPEKGVSEKSVRFDPLTGRIQYADEKGILKYVKPVASWGVDKSLIFHRITENFSRKWMFRVAFINKYEQDMAQPEYVKSQGAQKIERDATNFAINAVNAWAYEYAGHAKSKFIRGVPGQLDKNGNLENAGKVFVGSVSQSMNMLMHYPHSLIATQMRMIRGAKESAMVGDFLSPEAQYLYRYAGIYMGLQAASVLFNLDFNNIAENDTVEKIKEFHKSITEYDSHDKITRGALSNWFGPMPDDMRYALEVSGLKGADRSDFEKILLGNQNYAQQYGEDKDRAFWYKVGTTPGLIATKVGPAIADGRGWDVFRHLFRMYPSKWTKELHKKYIQPFKEKLFGKATVPIDKQLLGLAKSAETYGARYGSTTGYGK